MLRESGEYLTRELDFHLSHQREAWIGKIQVQPLKYVVAALIFTTADISLERPAQ